MGVARGWKEWRAARGRGMQEATGGRKKKSGTTERGQQPRACGTSRPARRRHHARRVCGTSRLRVDSERVSVVFTGEAFCKGGGHQASGRSLSLSTRAFFNPLLITSPSRSPHSHSFLVGGPRHHHHQHQAAAAVARPRLKRRQGGGGGQWGGVMTVFVFSFCGILERARKRGGAVFFFLMVSVSGGPSALRI